MRQRISGAGRSWSRACWERCSSPPAAARRNRLASRDCPSWTRGTRSRRCPLPRPATPTTRSRRASTRRPRRSTAASCSNGATLGDVPMDTFPFHLYWNAFRNNLSTSARGEGRRAARFRRTRSRLRLHPREARSCSWESRRHDLTPSAPLRRSPTTETPTTARCSEVQGLRPCRPRAPRRASRSTGRRGSRTAAVGAPAGSTTTTSSRSGSRRSACSRKENVERAPVPRHDRVLLRLRHLRRRAHAAAGLRGRSDGTAAGPVNNADGTRTLRFRQDDVHDFAWTASRRFLERTGALRGSPATRRWTSASCVQPEHAHLADRYLEATRVALRSYGAWAAPYPYGHVTVVDPAWCSASGGMEYPTLFTGGTPRAGAARAAEPGDRDDPRGRPSVLVRARRQQRVRGGLARRRASTATTRPRPLDLSYGPAGWGRRYFGGKDAARTPARLPGAWRPGSPSAAARTTSASCGSTAGATRWREPRGSSEAPTPTTSTPTASRRSVCRRSRRLVGDETMTRILRTYARRYRFAHPTTEDFIATVNEVTGQD